LAFRLWVISNLSTRYTCFSKPTLSGFVGDLKKVGFNQELCWDSMGFIDDVWWLSGYVDNSNNLGLWQM
jgi:hypothetical protein